MPKGLVDGIVRVTMDRLQAVTQLCDQYTTVKYTNFEKNNVASVNVIVRPLGE